LSLLGHNILFCNPFSNTLSLHSFVHVSNIISHPHIPQWYSFVYHIFIFLNSKLDDKRFCTDCNLLSISSWNRIWLFTNIWTHPPFQRNYYPSLYSDFALHSDLETFWI
jgi:hypothetical protein